jgi:hypothetical protein
VALPRLLDAEGGLGLAREHAADVPQLGRAAQRAVDEEAVHHHPQLVRRLGVAGNGVVRHGARKAPVPAVGVEPQQVVAVGGGLADPQFADGSAVGQRLVHLGSPDRSHRPCLGRFQPAPGERLRIATRHLIWCNAAE